jgi:hypothetical protein
MDDGDTGIPSPESTIPLNVPDASYVALQLYMPLQFCSVSGRVIYSDLNPGGIDCLYIVDYLA